MRTAFKRFFRVIFLAFITVAATAQTRDNVSRNTPKPKDTSTHKRPIFINVDTTRPVPVETKTLIRSVLRLKNIYANQDALTICRILNPDVYQHDSTLSNHTIILPNLPDPPSEIRRAMKDNFKKELNPDGEVNMRYSSSARKLDTLANLFSVTEFSSAEPDTGHLYAKIKRFLPPLASLTGQVAENIRRTSQKTVGMLTKEVDALNKILQRATSGDHLSAIDVQKIYSLMADINILIYVINDKKLQMDTGLVRNRNFNETIYLAASYSIRVKEPDAASGDDDPQKFNIYIFRKSILETTGNRNPEMDMYTISYVIPALEADPDEWSTIQKMASTTSESFAPARFKFSIKDNRTGKIYYAVSDLFNAAKDPNEKWTLMDLFNPHPVYRLMFLIP
ncbi:MAG: hypothetical protein M3Z92_03995 [Bacteroidota bacterium]|nr:hypothetical protein [Bacteroidota bacterium]